MPIGPSSRTDFSSSSSSGGIDFGGIIADLQKQQDTANLANEKRYSQMMAIFDEVISRYQPGGAFQKAGMAEIEKGMKRGVGKESQQLISSGLYGTTTGAQVGRRWEESYAAPQRLKLEDIMMQRLSQAQIGKAGAIERREDIGPDYGLVAQLAGQYGQGTGGGGSGGTGGGSYGQMRFGGNVSGSVGGTQAWGSYGAPAHAAPEEQKIVPQPLGLTANQLATHWGIGKKKKAEGGSTPYYGSGVTAGGQSAYMPMSNIGL